VSSVVTGWCRLRASANFTSITAAAVPAFAVRKCFSGALSRRTAMFINRNASRARRREAENARRNRAEIVKARSLGQISRRDLVKAGIFTAGGLLAMKNGLSPFAPSLYASVPTGTPLSPYPRRDSNGTIVDRPFLQPFLRMHTLTTFPLGSTGGSDARLVWPATLGEVDALRRANTTRILHTVSCANAANNGNVLVTGPTGPMEGRPPGEAFAHQRWNELVNGARLASAAPRRVDHVGRADRSRDQLQPRQQLAERRIRAPSGRSPRDASSAAPCHRASCRRATDSR
jgi:hypothetical protein